ncbi:DUF6318 family protein [Isoptericola sp. NEAU-Y5]|uniref:DUF6318 family protein n=1 Tax=Isoptericola luteus TaxID=2879484 RepID=A0ABS7ZH74_9MICO|nr:DUF6318 family protein [Isoptericola sp. NEAU-Y5]MCA5894362.1 DUF6318 family protein [Isoptericola sp. NEAU-Y5]
MTRSRAIYAAASLAAVLLVSGCDDDPPVAPTPEPTSHSASPDASPSASPTATAVVVAPERPDAMDDDGADGAEAAAVYFLELDDYMMSTGDTTEWEAMSHKSCQHCANRLKRANEIADEGYTWTSGPTSARVVHTYEQDAATGTWPMDIEVTQGAVTLSASDGSVIYQEDQVTLELGVEIASKNDSWVIVAVSALEDE